MNWEFHRAKALSLRSPIAAPFIGVIRFEGCDRRIIGNDITAMGNPIATSLIAFHHLTMSIRHMALYFPAFKV